MALNTVRIPETRPLRVQLTGPGTCGCVPVKSATTRSASISTRTRIGNGPLPSPSSSMKSSASNTPRGRRATAALAQRVAPVVRRAHRGRHVVDAVPAADLEHSAFGHLEAGRERREIADRHVRKAAVRADDRRQVAVELATTRDPDERQLQSLLEDLDRVGGPRARVLAADLRPVALRRGERDELVVHEDRPDHRDVREMAAAARVGVVRRHDVTGREIRHQDERVARGLAEWPEEPRDAVALRDELAARVGEPDGEVEDLVDQRDSARFA